MTHPGLFPLALRALLALPLATSAMAADLNSKVEELVFTDAALDKCVKSYAKREGYETVAAVKEIPCFNMGIKSIQGLEIFTEALVVDVSRNQIQDFTPLFTHTTLLGYVDIHDNPIKCGHMLKLARQLKRAYRVGFDANNCIMDGDEAPPAPSTPAPTTPETPTKPASTPPPPLPGNPAAEVTFATVAPIVAAACGSCHQSGKHKGGVALDDEVLLLKHARSSLSEIKEGDMPPKDPSWRTTQEAQVLLKYLEEQIASGRIPAGTGGHNHDDHEHDDDDDEHDDD